MCLCCHVWWMMCLCGNEPRCTATIFLDSPRGFQMTALFPKLSSLQFLILILNSRTVSAAGSILQGGRDKCLDCTDHSLLTCSLVYIQYVSAIHMSLLACTSIFKHGLIFRNCHGHGGKFIYKSAVQPPGYFFFFFFFFWFKFLFSLFIPNCVQYSTSVQ